jgi:TolB protein
MMPKNRLSASARLLFFSLPLFLAACAGDGDESGSPAAPAATSGPPAITGRIVYEARVGDALDIYTIDVQSGATAKLTDDGGSRHPSWSPDHAQIIFSSDRGQDDSQEELYIMRADGTELRRITETPGISEWHPRFSPDGARIAYMSQENDVGYVKVMNANWSDARRISGAFSLLRSGVWSPDGTDFFFTGLPQGANNIDIFSVDVGSGELTTRIATPTSEACPHVTNDGRTLTYGNVFKEADGKENIDLYAHDLTSADTSGASDVRLTDDPTVDDYGDPDASDATYVFVSRRDGNPDLYLMSRDGSNERPLTQTADIAEDNPDW